MSVRAIVEAALIELGEIDPAAPRPRLDPIPDHPTVAPASSDWSDFVRELRSDARGKAGSEPFDAKPNRKTGEVAGGQPDP